MSDIENRKEIMMISPKLTEFTMDPTLMQLINNVTADPISPSLCQASLNEDMMRRLDAEIAQLQTPCLTRHTSLSLASTASDDPSEMWIFWNEVSSLASVLPKPGLGEDEAMDVQENGGGIDRAMPSLEELTAALKIRAEKFRNEMQGDDSQPNRGPVYMDMSQWRARVQTVFDLMNSLQRKNGPLYNGHMYYKSVIDEAIATLVAQWETDNERNDTDYTQTFPRSMAFHQYDGQDTISDDDDTDRVSRRELQAIRMQHFHDFISHRVFPDTPEFAYTNNFLDALAKIDGEKATSSFYVMQEAIQFAKEKVAVLSVSEGRIARAKELVLRAIRDNVRRHVDWYKHATKYFQ